MMKWLKLALRNLGRNRRRTALTGTVVVVGAALTVFAWGIEEGAEMGSVENTTNRLQGQVQITSENYNIKPDVRDTLSNLGRICEELDNTPGVVSYSARTEAFGLIFGPKRSGACLLMGVEPQQETTTTTLHRGVITGEYLNGQRDRILISRSLSRVLGVVPGDTVVFLTQAADGSMGVDRLVVQGIFEAEGAKLALAHRDRVQSMLALPGTGVHRIVIRVNDVHAAAGIAADLAGRMPDLHVESWQDYLRVLVESSGLMRGFIDMTLFLLALLAVAGILNTSLVSVSERVREIGLVSALGGSAVGIFTQILWESVIISVVSVLIGIGSGTLITVVTGRTGLNFSAWAKGAEIVGWPSVIYPRTGPLFLQGLLTTCIVFLLAAIISGLAPALKAARLQPARAMRYR